MPLNMAYTTMFKGGWFVLVTSPTPSAAVQGLLVRSFHQPYTTYALEYGLHNHVQGWLVRSFHFPNTIGGCSRVAGPFFSLVPNNHLPRCGALAKCNPGGQPSTSVQSATAWVQRMGGHLWTSKWRFAVRRTYQTYNIIHISGRKCGFGVIRGASVPTRLPITSKVAS